MSTCGGVLHSDISDMLEEPDFAIRHRGPPGISLKPFFVPATDLCPLLKVTCVTKVNQRCPRADVQVIRLTSPLHPDVVTLTFRLVDAT
jgi:hypothetical protein